MRFEKWQALGNDYAIVEAEALPVALTAARVRLLCDPHHGIGADGVLELRRTDEPGFVAALRIFNPDGSEAELSGNGAREAILYLRRAGWTSASTFSIRTAAGEVRPTILDERTCRVDMGRAKLVHEEVDALAGTYAAPHLTIGNPQTPIRVDDPDALDLQELGPAIEHDPRFPNRTNVSFWRATGPDSIRARIFERGVGETASSGTGACGAAVAAVLRGEVDAPVTVQLDGGELEVDVDEAWQVLLTGWAEPVYRAEASDELLARLAALDRGPS